MIQEKTGYVETKAKQRLYYRVISPNKPKRTLLCLHGGPGISQDYLLTLSSLAEEKKSLRFVSYDQLGGGKSDIAGKSSYNIQNFREHVEDIRRDLDLGRVCLYGHSFGGSLALEYALKYPENVEKLIISNSSADISETSRYLQQLKRALPRDVYETLNKFEESDFSNQEFIVALSVFWQRHVCRGVPLDPTTTFNEAGEAYQEIWGHNEFVCTGNLHDWNVMDRIKEIKIPTLIVVGRYDLISVDHAMTCHKLIEGSKLLVLEESSHLNMFEKEHDKYLQAISDFILE